MTRDRLIRSFRSDRHLTHARVWRLGVPIAVPRYPYPHRASMPQHSVSFKLTIYLLDLGCHSDLVFWFADLDSALIHARRAAGDLEAQTEWAHRPWIRMHDEWIVE